MENYRSGKNIINLHSVESVSYNPRSGTLYLKADGKQLPETMTSIEDEENTTKKTVEIKDVDFLDYLVCSLAYSRSLANRTDIIPSETTLAICEYFRANDYNEKEVESVATRISESVMKSFSSSEPEHTHAKIEESIAFAITPFVRTLAKIVSRDPNVYECIESLQETSTLARPNQSLTDNPYFIKAMRSAFEGIMFIERTTPKEIPGCTKQTGVDGTSRQAKP